MVAERRKHIRFDADINGEFQAQGTNIQGMLTTDNFSRGGFKATLNQKVEIGTVLECEMIFPETIVPFFSSGKVVWLKENTGTAKQSYDAGISMEQIDPVERQCLIDYCYKKWGESRVEKKQTEFDLEF